MEELIPVSLVIPLSLRSPVSQCDLRTHRHLLLASTLAVASQGSSCGHGVLAQARLCDAGSASRYECALDYISYQELCRLATPFFICSMMTAPMGSCCG